MLLRARASLHAFQTNPSRWIRPLARRSCRPQHIVSRLSAGKSAHIRCLTSASAQQQQKEQAGINVEDVYEKKTPVEHVLLRPGMYIGSVEETEQSMWVLDDAAGDHFVNKVMKYNPGLYKIFDEILVNAIDNHARDKTTTRIDVRLPEPGDTAPTFSVRNNGRGIPVQFHSGEQVYVPEMVLGQLLTGSNFADAKAGAEAQYTGGRHGYGAKLTNIFSNKFSVETVDTSQRLRYRQEWTDNMTIRHEPSIRDVDPAKGGRDNEDFTKIEFVPDLSRFGMSAISNDMVKIFTKRVWEVAGCNPQVSVYLQGKKLPVPNMKSYVRMFVPEVDDNAVKFYSHGDKWNIAVTAASKATGSLSTVSFVNNTSTLRGGTHVTYILDQIAKAVAAHINSNKKKFDGVTATPALVRPHVFLFLNAKIANPSFDSQTKELLTSKPSMFGSSCLLPMRLIRDICSNCGIVEAVVSRLQSRDQAALIRSATRSGAKSNLLLDIPKLEDANLAGGSSAKVKRGKAKQQDSDRVCSLILTEGDSAKALAVAGLAVVGRDYYGVYPLRGKPLNARDAPIKQILANKELQDLVAALGLDFTKTYETEEDRSELRYGQVIIMADQDPDGSHIKGLVINFFHHFFPALLKHGFLSQFITPLVKAKPPRGAKDKSELQFFSIGEYNEWKRTLGDEANRWNIKYYKGLGTSTSVEARDYFSDLPKHLIPFQWSGEDDGDCIDMAFNKARVQNRKDWLLTYGAKAATRLAGQEGMGPGDDEVNVRAVDAALDVRVPGDGGVSFQEFINEELVQFSLVDLHRSIPSVVDGLKPSQRKVLFSCFKRKLTEEMKVAQLSGYCSEHAGYHHGEMSLHSTIVGMAQDFVGSNNLPLLEAVGQFGTRLQGGKDAASARYIFTKLSPLARALFPVEDDAVLDWLNDDGHPVEPRYYVPLIPLILVNGTKGIGTGWSTDVPCHKPEDVIDNLLHRLRNEDVASSSKIKPWYAGFEGDIVVKGKGENIQRFHSRGKVEQINTTEVLISELPVGVWTQAYKEFLLKAAQSGSVHSFTEEHSENSVAFRVKMSRAGLRHALQHKPKGTGPAVDGSQSGLESFFQLSSSHSMKNMHLFAPDGATVKRYANAEEVIDDFVPVRMETYQKRKGAQVEALEANVTILENKARFVDAITSPEKSIDITWPAARIEDHLRNEGYFGKQTAAQAAAAAKDGGEEGEAEPGMNFRYLLDMPISSLSAERVATLKQQEAETAANLAKLRETSVEDMWLSELEHLREALHTTKARKDKAEGQAKRRAKATRKRTGQKS